jgi:hypothetical protein
MQEPSGRGTETTVLDISRLGGFDPAYLQFLVLPVFAGGCAFGVALVLAVIIGILFQLSGQMPDEVLTVPAVFAVVLTIVVFVLGRAGDNKAVPALGGKTVGQVRSELRRLHGGRVRRSVGAFGRAMPQLLLAGGCVVGFSIGVFLSDNVIPPEPSLFRTLVLAPVGIACIVGGIYFAVKAFFAFTHSTAAEERDSDRRRPIVFLRSFRDDATVILDAHQKTYTPDDRFEVVIGHALKRFGPFVAIGRPGQWQRGAARDYYSNSEWQDAVTRWLQDASAIVMVAGTTPGVRWELTTALDLGLGEKLIILLPMSDPHRPRRLVALKEMFKGTPWEQELNKIDLNRAHAVTLKARGGLLIVASDLRRGVQRNSADALNFSLHAVLCQDGSGHV